MSCANKISLESILKITFWLIAVLIFSVVVLLPLLQGVCITFWEKHHLIYPNEVDKKRNIFQSLGFIVWHYMFDMSGCNICLKKLYMVPNVGFVSLERKKQIEKLNKKEPKLIEKAMRRKEKKQNEDDGVNSNARMRSYTKAKRSFVPISKTETKEMENAIVHENVKETFKGINIKEVLEPKEVDESEKESEPAQENKKVE